MRSLQKGNNMVTNNRAAWYRLVFLYQLLHKGEVVYIGITNNPHARMIEHWQKGFLFDRMEILREDPTRRGQARGIEQERIARYQTKHGRPPQYNRAVPLPVKNGTRLPARKIPMSANEAQRLGIPEIYPDRSAFDGLVFYYQLLHKGKVVHSGRESNPAAQMMNYWQKGFVFDRMEILRHRIERYQIQSEELQRHILTAPRPVSDGMPAGGLEKGDRDEPTLCNKTMTACSLRKKNGAVETTRQPSQVTCGNCLRSQ